MRDDEAAAVAVLRDPATIRARCRNIAEAVEAGRSAHFGLVRERLPGVADRVAALTRERFPDLRIPYHSRWRHFEAGGVDRRGQLGARLAGRPAAEIARAQIDLALVSVLLDAGAGPDWRYEEAGGAAYTRSEGLAVASFDAFVAGRFSASAEDPLRVDAAALAQLDGAALAALFQAGPGNPLVGLEGRAALLRRLGAALDGGRPGSLFDALAGEGGPVEAGDLLQALLARYSAIWPSGQRFGATPVGDAWRHPLAGGEGASAGWVPFHKLSQWLAYSLLEPFEWAGIAVRGLEALTGLPEYRNGGLLIDAGVIQPRDPSFAALPRTPADPWVIEWRALTVHLLDALAPLVRDRLGAPDLPLACILEGGTWQAGRRIAAERRPGGAPPLAIESDGTVF